MSKERKKAHKRSKSKRVDDSSLVEKKEQTKKIVDKSLKERPSVSQLEEKGIIKNKKGKKSKPEKLKKAGRKSSSFGKRGRRGSQSIAVESIPTQADSEIIGRTLAELRARDGCNVPPLVPACIGQIRAKGMEAEGIFRISGNASEIGKLKLLFTKKEFVSFEATEFEVHCATGLLKLFFREMPEPLFTFELHHKFNGVLSGNVDLKQQINSVVDLLKQLPPENLECVRMLLPLLYEVTTFSNVNKMEPANIGIVFGPTLMRSAEEAKGQIDMTNKSSNTIRFIVKNWPNVHRVLEGGTVVLAAPPEESLPERPALVAPASLAEAPAMPPPSLSVPGSPVTPGACAAAAVALPQTPASSSSVSEQPAPVISTPPAKQSPVNRAAAKQFTFKGKKRVKSKRWVKKRPPHQFKAKGAKQDLKHNRKSLAGPLAPPKTSGADSRRASTGEATVSDIDAVVTGSSIALFDFTGDAALGQVNLVKGARVTVITVHPGGWTTVESNGATGYVPSSYVE